tara:strand:+ start:647 stop:922 length:276 start_codon:yes stop_codon:yes gene_type:complete
MKVRYTSPAVIQLLIAQALLDHQRWLTKLLENKDITFEELKRREFPIDAHKILDAAVQKAFDINGIDAEIDAEKYLAQNPLKKLREAANEN